jgi:eukaryotic-like serine/threonine-protein kinase
MERERTLAGRYQLGAVIGRGGMGTVYRGTDLVLERPVAVKVISGPLAAEEPARIARMEREAKATAALAHPAVVTVYDAGTDGVTPFIVMEHLVGRDLAAKLRESAPLPARETMRIAEQVASALAAAHAAGMIHRDIKPANVLLTDTGAVKVLDFGIARARDRSALTQAGTVAGTAAYMAPELAMGGEADERSDVYSLGCLIYAMLSGAPPFSGQTDAAILHQHVNAKPRPLRASSLRLPEGLAELVEQMLSKSPDARPGNAGEVAERLRRMTLASPPTVATQMGLGRPTAEMPPVVRSKPSASRTRVMALALLAAAFAAVLITLSTAGSPGPAQASHNDRGSGFKAALQPARTRQRASAQRPSSPVSDSRQSAGAGTAHVGPQEGAQVEQQEDSAAEGQLQEQNRPAGPPTAEGPRAAPPGEPPGHDGAPPGHGGVPPGHGGVPPGHAEAPHGQSGGFDGGPDGGGH